MLFYTDRISEARDSSGAFYSLDRCPALLGGQDPGAALDRLCDDVVRHVGHRLHDDAAMLLISPLRRIDNQRMGHLRALFAGLSIDPAEVEARCLLIFSLLIGNHYITADHGGYSRADILELALRQLATRPGPGARPGPG